MPSTGPPTAYFIEILIRTKIHWFSETYIRNYRPQNGYHLVQAPNVLNVLTLSSNIKALYLPWSTCCRGASFPMHIGITWIRRLNSPHGSFWCYPLCLITRNSAIQTHSTGSGWLSSFNTLGLWLFVTDAILSTNCFANIPAQSTDISRGNSWATLSNVVSSF